MKRLVHADKQGFFAQYQIDYLMEQLTDQSQLTSVFFAHGIIGLMEHYLMNDISEKEIAQELDKITKLFH